MPEQDSLARLISLVRRRLKQVVGRRVAGLDLTSQQFWVMVFLSEHDGPALCELCAQLRMDAPTASRIVSGLAGRGLLRPVPDPKDRRRNQLRLTARGRALGQRLLPIAREARGSVERDLTPPEARELRRLLRKVLASVDRYDAEGDAA